MSKLYSNTTGIFKWRHWNWKDCKAKWYVRKTKVLTAQSCSDFFHRIIMSILGLNDFLYTLPTMLNYILKNIWEERKIIVKYSRLYQRRKKDFFKWKILLYVLIHINRCLSFHSSTWFSYWRWGKYEHGILIIEDSTSF